MTNAVQSTQLNLNRFNPIYFENQVKIANNLKWKALAYKVLEKITFIALAAIMAATVAVSFGVGAGIAGLPTIVFAAVLTSPLLSLALSKAHAKVAQLTSQRDFASLVAAKQKEISGYSDQRIEKNLLELGIVKNHLRLSDLKEMNNKNPIRALIPVLARFAVYVKEMKDAQNQADQGLSFTPQGDIANTEEIQLDARQRGWRTLERRVMPAAMQAALMLQIIQNPQMKFTSLSEIGSFRMRDFDQRVWKQTLDHNDDYFVPSASTAPRINFTSLLENGTFTALNPVAMRNILFPTERA